MANVIEITDLSAPGPAVFARLTEAQLRSRQEPAMGLFIAEGTTVIGHALDAGLTPVALLSARRHIEGKARGVIARCGDAPVYTADDALLADLTGYALTRGVLCAMRRPSPITPEAVCAGGRRIAVLENCTDAANVGAIFRSAAALGMDAVLLTPGCCDPLCRRAVRVSMGGVFQVPWARIGRTQADWPAGGLALLQYLGFRTAALALTDRAVSILDERLAAADRLAILLGAEGDGLTAETLAACDDAVRIPMSHCADSLNVAAAAAIAFWQLRVRK